MSSAQVGAILRYIRKLAVAKSDEQLPDQHLLERFTSHQDESAFATLLRRHGPMVLSVCRSVLRDPHDAEDAFQATFVILAQKAGSIHRREAVSSWLYRVAYHLAAKARARAARRRIQERKAVTMPAGDPLLEMNLRELRAVLYEELQRLPEKYRAPLVLCYLEEKTQEEAARLLGWSKGAVKGRLERGRDRLRARLVKRGLELSMGLFITALAQKSAAATVSAVLGDATLKAALAVGAGKSIGGSGAISAEVTALVQGVSKSMFWGKVKSVAGLALVAGLAIAGTGITAHQLLTAQVRLKQEDSTPKEARKPQGVSPKPKDPTRSDLYGDPLPEGAISRLGTVRFRVPHNWVVAFCREGKTFVTGLDDALLIFDVATGKIIHRFATPNRVESVAISPDGKTVAAGEDNGVRLWDVPSGRQLRQLSAPGSYIRALLFRPDGKALATAGVNGPFRLWDLKSGKEIWKRGGADNPPSPLDPVAFSADGKILLTQEDDGETIIFLDAASGQDRRRLKGPGRGSDPVFSPDLKKLASAGNDRAIHLWDLTTGKEFRKIPGMQGRPEYYAFSPDSKFIAWARGDGGFSLIDVATGKELRRIGKSLGLIRLLTFWPDEKTLAFGAWWEKTVRFWDIENDKEIHPPEGHRGDISSFVYSADGKNLVSSSMDGTIRYWDPATGKELHQFLAHQRGVWGMALSPDGKTLATGSLNDKVIRVWDGPTGKEVRRLEGHRGGIHSLAFSPDGKVLASGGSTNGVPKEGRLLRLWEVSTSKELPQFAVQPYPVPAIPPGQEGETGILSVSSVEFSPDGRFLASLCYNTLVTWEVATGRQHCHITFPRAIKSIVFSHDGKTLASAGRPTADGKGSIRLWEVASGKERLSISTMRARTECLAFSPDGRFLAAGGSDAKMTDLSIVRVLDVRTGQILREFQGHQSWLTALAFSPDGTQLASGSWDTTILIWKLADLPQADRPTSGKLSANVLEQLWSDLASEDAEKGYRAITRLVAMPQQSLALIKERLKPALPADPARIASLIGKLDDERFSIRQKAVEELSRLEELAEPALRKALGGQPPLEVRSRIEMLLGRLQGPINSPEKLRSLRALEVLEHMNIAQARDLLKNLAEGTPQVRLTQEAKDSLERLAKRPVATP